jgi:SAM-dependent methyltransferase
VIYRYLEPRSRILDVGCGRYLRFCREFAGVARVFGVDLERAFETDNQANPFAVRADVAALPFAAGSFDMVISRSVVEHLEDPPAAFAEILRVLRPGGRAVIITPNKYDYVTLIAAVTPYSFHRFVVSRIFRIPEDDVFPTRYRANTMSAMRRAMTAAGFREREMDTINHYPAYLMFSPVLFRLGVLYERLTSMKMFRSLRGSILCVFEKPGAALPVGARTATTSGETITTIKVS